MSDYETLKECKIAWEILNDLVCNCTIISEEDTETRESLVSSMDLLSDLYSNAWELLASNKETHKQLETNVVDRFGHKCIISDLIGYAYLCETCDENQYCCECSKYITEMESEYKKYAYEDFDTLEQARNELVKYVKNGELGSGLLEEINEELKDKNENIPYCNELIEEVASVINQIIEERTNLCWWL